MISDHASVGSADRNPDLIPISKDLSASDEDAGFGSHGEKTRYATLQRMQRYTPAPSSSNYNQQQCDPNTRAGYQTMRPYRHDNSGIPTISQEVTYAELTMPRGGGGGLSSKANSAGYASMRPSSTSTSGSSSGHNEPSVIYARINHNNRLQQMSVPAPNHSNLTNNQQQLLVQGGNGGGVSPNSLMNTSLDSSSTSTSTSGTTQRQTKKAPSSVEDEGFNSCSGCHSSESPDNAVPIILSPQSESTRDTNTLVSSTASSSSGCSPIPMHTITTPPGVKNCSSSVPLLAAVATNSNDCKESHV